MIGSVNLSELNRRFTKARTDPFAVAWTTAGSTMVAEIFHAALINVLRAVMYKQVTPRLLSSPLRPIEVCSWLVSKQFPKK